MTTSKKILPHILILLAWFSRIYCEGEESICTTENEQLCYLLCDSYRREIDLCSYFPSLCETRINCEEVAYKCWNEIPDCGQISISDKTEIKRGAPTRGFAFFFLKLHPLFSQTSLPRLSTSARYRRIGQRFGSEFLGKRHIDFFPKNETDEDKWKIFYDDLQEDKRSKLSKNRNFGSELLGKRSKYILIPNRFAGNELLGKRGLEFLGKRGLEFLGKRNLEFLGKRSLEFLGKRGNEFLGKRNLEFLGKRNNEFLGKRADEAQDLLSNEDQSNSSDLLDFRTKRGKGQKGYKLGSEFLGKRSGEGKDSVWVRYPFGEPEYRDYVKNENKDEKKYKGNSNSNLNQKKEKVLGKMISVSEFLG